MPALLDGPVMRLVVVHLDEERFGMPVDLVLEVLPSAATVALPGAPAVVEGLLNLRGTFIPVVDLRVRLGRERRTPSLTDHVLVCEVRGRPVGVRVDRAEELVDLPAEGFEPVASVAAAENVAGVVARPDGLLLVTDVASFLTADEVLGLDRALAEAGGSR